MRFAFISLDFLSPRPSSIGLTTALLAGEIIARGHEVVVLAFSDERTERFVDERGIAVLPVRRGGEGRAAEIALRWRIRNRLAKEIKSRGLDGVEVPDFLGLLPFGRRGVPVQVRLHNSVTSLCRFRGAREGFLMRMFERLTLARAERWVGASEFAFRRTEEVFELAPKQMFKIPCPVDIGERCDDRREDGLFVFCGPLNWLKGGDLFVKIARRAGERGINGSFIVLGEDADGMALRDGGLVDCLGHLPHGRALEVLQRATAIIAPSRIEFQGVAVAEAMARGVPAILPRREPFTEFFSTDDVYFVEGEEPDRWVDSIEAMARGPAGARTVGAAGRKCIAERFSPARVADRWLASWRTGAGAIRD